MKVSEKAELEVIRFSEKNDGVVTPKDVVRIAKRKTSALHKHFVWDDKVAGAKYREHIARQIISGITFKVVEKPKLTYEVSSFVRDVSRQAGEQGYVRVDTILNEKEQSFSTLKYELNRMISSYERMSNLAMYFGLQDEVQDLVRRHIALRDKLEKEAA